MHHESLLLNLAVCLAAALLCGWVAAHFRFSPIVGYLVAGLVCGPFTPGWVANPDIAEELADIGVILLMFGVGLHFNFRELVAVRRVVVPGALIQGLIATAVVTGAGHLVGLTWRQSLVVGLAFSVCSTAVLARMLTDHHQLSTPAGQLAIGWSVVGDVFTVVVLLLLPMLAARHGDDGGFSELAKTFGAALGKFTVLVGLIVVLGNRLVPWLLAKAAGSSEIFNLTVMVVALGTAWFASEFFGVSLALGSFLAGVVAGQSPQIERVEASIGPLRDAFAALFFLAIGTLVDPEYVISHPVRLLISLAVILVLNPITALVLVRFFDLPLHTALVVAIGLAQVGEFSFILIRLGHELNLLPLDVGHQLIAAAMISIMLNPILFRNLPRIERLLRRVPQWQNA
ncbi:MAG: cation:proton antiporter [Verrucomicrobia bacterium]|nr:cation:proton antiporter [Verrucomicrobiota bacterium]